MTLQKKKRIAMIHKELRLLEKKEARLKKAALERKSARWKQLMEEKLPDKVYTGLESAFCKAFSLVFRKGRALLEKGVRKETILTDHRVSHYVVQQKGSRRELRRMGKNAGRSNLNNLAITTVEGIGLGALGIGLPDIVLFIGTLLKGVYETALHYGYAYDTRAEQMLILKMLAASLSGAEDWERRNEAVDRLLACGAVPATDEVFEAQIQKTASAFALDMLVLKFIQGLPVVGVLGGAANPVYYRKIMRYVQLKYRKRYLWQLLKREQQSK